MICHLKRGVSWGLLLSLVPTLRSELKTVNLKLAFPCLVVSYVGSNIASHIFTRSSDAKLLLRYPQKLRRPKGQVTEISNSWEKLLRVQHYKQSPRLVGGHPSLTDTLVRERKRLQRPPDWLIISARGSGGSILEFATRRHFCKWSPVCKIDRQDNAISNNF